VISVALYTVLFPYILFAYYSYYNNGVMIINILHNIIFCVQQKKVTQQKVWDNKRVVLNIFWLNSPFKFGLP